MSRGLRDDDRADLVERASDRRINPRGQSRIDCALAHGLTLPRGEQREHVEFRSREYSLNGSETRALATVGAFRVVCPDDLGNERAGRGVAHGDWRHLAEQGLVTRESLTDREGVRHIVALTQEGKDLLDAHSTTRPDGRRQEYYADVVKPRELRHDSQLYRVYSEEAARIEREGGRVTRVVLDYEMKRDYQHFLNREDRDAEADPTTDRRAFAEAQHLTIVKGHVELPDLRIEYETDGRTGCRDVELVTEHYSRGQLAGKARAGFTCYRASSSGGNRKGSTPFDPHHLERLE